MRVWIALAALMGPQRFGRFVLFSLFGVMFFLYCFVHR